MNAWKKWAVAAGILLGVGVIISAVSFAVLGCDWNRLSTQEYVTNTHTPEGDFRDIRIETDTEDLLFVMTTDSTCTVVCHEEAENPFEVRIQNGTLLIDRPAKTRMHLQFGIITESPSITVYLPTKEYGEISLKTDTGDVTLSGIRLTGNLEIREHSGRISLTDLSCADLTVRSDTGDQTLTNVAASGAMTLTTDTGDVRFDRSDASSLQIKTDTGDVTGSLRSDKIFTTKSDTGTIEVPDSTAGGPCDISTDTGDIRITIQN
ncbi:MAG: DUF4097 family beta strand repeat protein [Lachnospiraceae bacterium]|nr:DUF4097 family beta strand repeat protein [Lachnospiraceae bacterium]